MSKKEKKSKITEEPHAQKRPENPYKGKPIEYLIKEVRALITSAFKEPAGKSREEFLIKLQDCCYVIAELLSSGKHLDKVSEVKNAIDTPDGVTQMGDYFETVQGKIEPLARVITNIYNE